MRFEATRAHVDRRRGLSGLFARLGNQWCRLMHSDITWPVNGYYSCRKCHRRFPVPWENPEAFRVPPRPAAGLVEEPLPALAESLA